MHLKIFLSLAILFTFSITIASHTPTFAETNATINVTTNQDEFDTSGTGMGCSLREAIQAANTDKAFGGCPAGSGADTIVLQNGTYQIERSGQDDKNKKGDYDIKKDLVIRGQGANVTTIDGNKLDRVFQTYANLTLQDLKIINGAPDIDAGGAIYAEKNLTLENVILTKNETPREGGAIFSNTDDANVSIIIRSSTIQDNRAGTFGGGIYSTVALSIENSTFDLNKAVSSGGALFNVNQLTLKNSTLTFNAVGTHGGGIYNTGQGVIVNSTIVGNEADRDGGGIMNDDTATLKLYNATIVYNHADKNNDNTGSGGGVRNPTCANNCNIVVLYNTLIGNNLRKNTTADDTNGYFELGGYNLLEAPGGQYVGDTTHLIAGMDPKTGGLGNNGGTTQTVALLAGSPALDAGNPKGCKDDKKKLLVTDQRGSARTTDGDGLTGPRCDIGAFEAPISNTCAAKPNKPTLNKPMNGNVTTTPRVKLDWSDVACADNYIVQIKRDAKNGTPIQTIKMLVLSQAKTQTLDAGHTFYWRVKACNGNGCAASGWNNFSVQ